MSGCATRRRAENAGPFLCQGRPFGTPIGAGPSFVRAGPSFVRAGRSRSLICWGIYRPGWGNFFPWGRLAGRGRGRRGGKCIGCCAGGARIHGMLRPGTCSLEDSPTGQNSFMEAMKMAKKKLKKGKKLKGTKTLGAFKDPKLF